MYRPLDKRESEAVLPFCRGMSPQLTALACGHRQRNINGQTDGKDLDTRILMSQLVTTLSLLNTKAAFTGCKLPRASKMPGMRAQTFHTSYENFYMFNFEASCDFRCYICTIRLPAHPRYFTRVRQLASCKRRLQAVKYEDSAMRW
jgi:hypothetical protein